MDSETWLVSPFNFSVDGSCSLSIAVQFNSPTPIVSVDPVTMNNIMHIL